MARALQIVEGELDIRVISRPLEDLAIHLKEGRPAWFGLSDRLADCPLKGITVYRAVDSDEEAKLLLRTGMTSLLRKPYA